MLCRVLSIWFLWKTKRCSDCSLFSSWNRSSIWGSSNKVQFCGHWATLSIVSSTFQNYPTMTNVPIKSHSKYFHLNMLISQVLHILKRKFEEARMGGSRNSIHMDMDKSQHPHVTERAQLAGTGGLANADTGHICPTVQVASLARTWCYYLIPYNKCTKMPVYSSICWLFGALTLPHKPCTETITSQKWPQRPNPTRWRHKRRIGPYRQAYQTSSQKHQPSQQQESRRKLRAAERWWSVQHSKEVIFVGRRFQTPLCLWRRVTTCPHRPQKWVRRGRKNRWQIMEDHSQSL